MFLITFPKKKCIWKPPVTRDPTHFVGLLGETGFGLALAAAPSLVNGAEAEAKKGGPILFRPDTWPVKINQMYR